MTSGRHATRSEIWHERPVLAPTVYAVSTATVGAIGYAFGFLLLDSVQKGIAASLFLNGLLVLYLRACHREAVKERVHDRH